MSNVRQSNIFLMQVSGVRSILSKVVLTKWQANQAHPEVGLFSVCSCLCQGSKSIKEGKASIHPGP